MPKKDLVQLSTHQRCQRSALIQQGHAAPWTDAKKPPGPAKSGASRVVRAQVTHTLMVWRVIMASYSHGRVRVFYVPRVRAEN